MDDRRQLGGVVHRSRQAAHVQPDVEPEEQAPQLREQHHRRERHHQRRELVLVRRSPAVLESSQGAVEGSAAQSGPLDPTDVVFQGRGKGRRRKRPGSRALPVLARHFVQQQRGKVAPGRVLGTRLGLLPEPAGAEQPEQRAEKEEPAERRPVHSELLLFVTVKRLRLRNEKLRRKSFQLCEAPARDPTRLRGSPAAGQPFGGRRLRRRRPTAAHLRADQEQRAPKRQGKFDDRGWWDQQLAPANLFVIG